MVSSPTKKRRHGNLMKMPSKRGCLGNIADELISGSADANNDLCRPATAVIVSKTKADTDEPTLSVSTPIILSPLPLVRTQLQNQKKNTNHNKNGKGLEKRRAKIELPRNGSRSQARDPLHNDGVVSLATSQKQNGHIEELPKLESSQKSLNWIQMLYSRQIPIIVMQRKIRPFVMIGLLVGWFFVRILRVGSHSLVHSSALDLIFHGLNRVEKVWQVSSTEELFLRGWIYSLFGKILLVQKDVVAIVLLQTVWRFLYYIRYLTKKDWTDWILDTMFDWSKNNVTYVSNYLQRERIKMRLDMEQSVLAKDPHRIKTLRLPLKGQTSEELIEKMTRTAEKEDQHWINGKVSGCVYTCGKSHTELLSKVYEAYMWSNPLHSNVWPSVNQYESEVIAMTANLLCGSSSSYQTKDTAKSCDVSDSGASSNGVVGCMTSGGTESIILAIKAHYYYYGKHRGIATGCSEVICCSTAHASVDKACEMFHLRKVVIECDPQTFILNPDLVRKRITANTIMIYASAPSFPQGVIDPIQELSDIARLHDIGLHVDACLGGFVLPFAKKIPGVHIPKFDFECEGVTSMSIDTHKYGYATKGTSVVLYRHQELRQEQYYNFAQWSGGLYSTPTLAGSRAGALIACAWAAMVSIGESGYQSRVESIVKTSIKIANGIRAIPGLRVMLGTQCPTMIVCFGVADNESLDIYRIGDVMNSNKGWELNSLQNPASIHLCVTMNACHGNVAEKFLNDLKNTVEEVRKEDTGGKKNGNAAIYGKAGSLPAGPVNELLKCYTDMTLTP